jgi:hypothetical protein
MRVLVCGGRDYADDTRVCNALNKLHGKFRISMVIHGAAPGADTLAAKWARKAAVEEKAFRANWAEHGKAAGPMRNQAMLIYGMPDAVVAFPGGRGTEDMIARAETAGLKVWRPYG